MDRAALAKFETLMLLMVEAIRILHARDEAYHDRSEAMSKLLQDLVVKADAAGAKIDQLIAERDEREAGDAAHVGAQLDAMVEKVRSALAPPAAPPAEESHAEAGG